jgi:hypothetical protein
MKTSIFDMNFVLPPVVEMTEVMKDMPSAAATYGSPGSGGRRHCC